MNDNVHTAIYAAVLGTVCAVLLTAASVQLRPYQEANEEAERFRNVLGVLGVQFDKKAPWKELDKVYKHAIREEGKGEERVCRRIGPDGEVLSVAVPLTGRGRNGPIKGFLALGPDMRTIRGITFYDHKETPGLGGEIETNDFRERFVGKRIAGDGRIGIAITRPDQADGPYEVDGISGATVTCRKVEKILNAKIARLIEQGGAKEGGDGG